MFIPKLSSWRHAGLDCCRSTKKLVLHVCGGRRPTNPTTCKPASHLYPASSAARVKPESSTMDPSFRWDDASRENDQRHFIILKISQEKGYIDFFTDDYILL